jgi:hypothetical protein
MSELIKSIFRFFKQVWSDIFYAEISITEAKNIIDLKSNNYEVILVYLDLFVLSDGQNLKALSWKKQVLLWFRWRLLQFVFSYPNNEIIQVSKNADNYPLGKYFKYRPKPIAWVQSIQFPLIPLVNFVPFDANYNLTIQWLCFSFITSNYFTIVESRFEVSPMGIVVQVRCLYFSCEVFIGLYWIGELLHILFYRKSILDKRAMVDNEVYDGIISVYGIECFQKQHYLGSYLTGTTWWRTLILWFSYLLDFMLFSGNMYEHTYKKTYSK